MELPLTLQRLVYKKPPAFLQADSTEIRGKPYLVTLSMLDQSLWREV